MGSEFKKKLLAAAASSPLLRIAAIFLMRQFTDAHKSRLTPHKGGSTHRVAPSAIAHQARLGAFVPVSSAASQWPAHTRSHRKKEREVAARGDLSRSIFLVPDSSDLLIV